MGDNKEKNNFDVFTGGEVTQTSNSDIADGSPPVHNAFPEKSYEIAKAKIVDSEYVRKQD